MQLGCGNKNKERAPYGARSLLHNGRILLRIVRFGVRLGSFGGVMLCIRMMTMSSMRVMRRFFMVASGVMLRRFAMMLGSTVMMLRGAFVVVGHFLFHNKSPHFNTDVYHEQFMAKTASIQKLYQKNHMDHLGGFVTYSHESEASGYWFV